MKNTYWGFLGAAIAGSILLGVETNPMSAREHSVAPRDVPARMEGTINSISAATFRTFLRDSVRWEERTKLWRSFAAEDGSPQIGRMSAVAEENVVRMNQASLADGLPRVLARYVNEGSIRGYDLRPGDSVFVLAQMERGTGQVRGYAVHFDNASQLSIYDMGTLVICHRWTHSKGDLSSADLVDPRTCEPGAGAHEVGTPRVRRSAWTMCDQGCCEWSRALALDPTALVRTTR